MEPNNASITNPVPPAAQAAPHDQLPSAFDLFGLSWEAIKLNLDTFIFLWIVPVALTILSLILSFSHNWGSAYGTRSTGASLWLGPAVAVIYLLIGAPLLVTFVKSAQSVKISAGDALKQGLSRFFPFIGITISLGIIIGVGFLLLIVPGVFLLKRYMLAPYAMFSDNLGIRDSFKRSAELSSKNGGAIWGIMGVDLLIGLVGIIPIIGYIVSFVCGLAYSCAPALRYEQLKALGGGNS